MKEDMFKGFARIKRVLIHRRTVRMFVICILALSLIAPLHLAVLSPVAAESRESDLEFTLQDWPRDWPADLMNASWGNNQFVAVGTNSTILTSPNGETWMQRDVKTEGIIGFMNVTWGGGQYIAVGSMWDDKINDTRGMIFTSPNGVVWTEQVSKTKQDLRDVIWNGSQYVIGGEWGTILTSPDGIIWAVSDTGTDKHIYAVTWNGSQYVAVGSRGLLLTSTDGIEWTEYESESTLLDIIWAKNQFVAVGSKGRDRIATILISKDGLTWTEQGLGESGYLSSITWNGNKLVVVGNYYDKDTSIILTSPDGATWVEQEWRLENEWGNNNSIHGVTVRDNQLVMVGSSGMILTSKIRKTATLLEEPKTSTPSTWAVMEIEKGKRYNLLTEKVVSNYQQDITREEFCELVVNLYEELSGKTAPLPAVNIFKDTSNHKILKANALEIVNGISETEFDPSSYITREQIAVMFHRALTAIDESLTKQQYEVTFNDKDEISTWALEAVGYMNANEILGGVGDNKVNPRGNATREQSIALVVRIFEIFK